MAVVERTYNVPLRKEWLKTPAYKRAKKAVTALREFIQKNMKTKDVLIGDKLNKEIWKDGIKNPPHHVKVVAVKDEKGICKVELFGHKYVEKKVQTEKTKKAHGLAGKLQEKLGTVKGSKEKTEEVAKDDKPKSQEEKTESPVVKNEEPVKAEEKKEEPKEAKAEKTEQPTIAKEETSEEKKE